MNWFDIARDIFAVIGIITCVCGLVLAGLCYAFKDGV